MKRQDELFAKWTPNYNILQFHTNANLKFTTAGKKNSNQVNSMAFQQPNAS